MKFTYVSVAIAAFVGTVAAQSLAGLPTCAQGCVNNALPKNCNLLDIKCICTSKTFLSDISCCVSKSCNAADQKSTIQFADNICGSSGVTNLPQSATCASGAGTTATGAPASSGTSTAAAATTMTGTMTSSTSMASSTGAAASGSGSSTAASGSSSASASAASPSASKAAAPVSGPNVAAVGALAVFALLV